MFEHKSLRQAAAAKIKARPSSYKVCESCGSIVARRTSTCPNCFGYRFDGKSKSVCSQAEALALRSPLSIQQEDYV
ncbi:MAG: hypothetical protein SH807_06085 [Blastochloris sp.]|nr:hypothetical protein [Blastochloris sp.]